MLNIFSSIRDTIMQYVDVYLKLLKVNAIGKTSGLLAYVMFAFICLLLLFCTMVLLGFGLVEAFCALGIARVASFFITFGIYVLLMFVLISMRKSITRAFANTFIRILTEGDDDSNTTT